MSQRIAPEFLKRFFTIFFMGLLLQGWSAHAALKDTESASHDDSAANPDVIKTYDYPGVKIVQYNLAVLSHYSYMIISDNNALVVDPVRDIQVYIEAAKKEGVRIKGVFLTHSHADFIAGHLEFVKAVGCPVYQNKDSGAAYKIHALFDGQTIPWGQATLEFLSTPGHTPDGMCMLIYGKDSKKIPKAILTGDTLFVGSIGRPDLLGDAMSAAALAGMSYDTWVNTLSKLDDDVVILPAHGAGSLCGAQLRDEPFSTIGTERKTNPYLHHKWKNDFITAVLEGLPEAPRYFGHNAKMNRSGPAIVDWSTAPPAMPNLDKSLTNTDNYYVVDLRAAESYSAGHIPNAVNIGLRGRLETWVGIMAPWNSDIVLCGSSDEMKEATRRLSRVGYKVTGWAPFDAWVAADQPVYRNEVIAPMDLYKRMQDGIAPLIVDVRLPAEWMGSRIGNVVNMPLNQLALLAVKLDPGEPVVTVCNSAYRSSLGIGLLERLGFKKVASMAGGGQAWIEAGLPVTQAAGLAGAAAHPKRIVNLPDLIDPAQLNRMLMDLPGAFDLVDIRPPAFFADYNLPGSRNVDIADLTADPVYLTGAGSLVIVDRNGSLAMAAGGILSQKTDRRIKVLFGGLEAYWRSVRMGEPIRTEPLLQETPSPAPVAPTPPRPETQKKKSAGC